MLKFEAGSSGTPTPPLTISGTPHFISRFNTAGDNIEDSCIEHTVSGSSNLIQMFSPNSGECLRAVFNNSPSQANLFTWRHIAGDANASYFGIFGDSIFTTISGYDQANLFSHAVLGTKTSTGVPVLKLYHDPTVNSVYLWNDGNFKITNNGVTFTWPTADGTAGQVLKTNGAGVLSWVTGGAGDMVLASAQTNSGAKTFLDQTLLFRNPANTFSYTIVAGAIAANRSLNLPVLTGADTLAVLGLAQTFTGNLTFNGTNNVFGGYISMNGVQINSGTSGNYQFRTTNAGSNITPILFFGTPATVTAGTFAAGIDQNQGVFFTAGNGTRHIQRAGINIKNLTNTAASESGDLTFLTQSAGTAVTEKVTITAKGNVLLAVQGALATNATDGFTYIPTCAGAPSGAPTANTGMVAMVYDTTNNKFYIYNGAWRGGTVPGAFV